MMSCRWDRVAVVARAAASAIDNRIAVVENGAE